jgi:hypothetical protein
MGFFKSVWHSIERVVVMLFMILSMLFTAPDSVFSADLTVSFTAPADAFCESCPYDVTVTEYNVYYATAPFDSTNFRTVATMQNFCATPNSPGTAETCTLTGLQGGTTYYIALTSVDAAGNESMLSNVVTKATPDVTPPQRINDLVVTVGG